MCCQEADGSWRGEGTVVSIYKNELAVRRSCCQRGTISLWERELLSEKNSEFALRRSYCQGELASLQGEEALARQKDELA